MNLSELFNKPKMVRYGIIFAGILILLKIMPNTSLTFKDIIVLTIVLFALYVIVENVFTKASLCGVENLDGSVNSSLSSVNSSSSNVKSSTKINIPIKNISECTDCVKKTVGSDGMETYVYKSDLRKYETGPTRAEADVITSEVQYTDYNILPVTPEDSRLYEYGYSFLPPEKWYPVPPHPPICVTEKRCPIYPITTTGTPIDMKEWDASRRITPGDVINIDYARDKLNSGR